MFFLHRIEISRLDATAVSRIKKKDNSGIVGVGLGEGVSVGVAVTAVSVGDRVGLDECEGLAVGDEIGLGEGEEEAAGEAVDENGCVLTIMLS